MTNDGVKILQFGAGQKQIQPLALGTSTSETAFALNGNTAANPAIADTPAILTLPDVASIPASGQPTPTFVWDNGKPFMIQAWGTCVTGASTNLTLTLYQVPLSVIPTLAKGSVASCNSIHASSARAVNSTTGKLLMQAVLQWDSVSKLLHGQISFEINDLLDVFGATTAVTTLAQDADLNFILSATLSTGNAANIVNLYEFSAQSV